MRLKISLKSKEDTYRIPFNYNYILSAIVYRKIADLDLASQLHFSSDFKYFTFSQIYVQNRNITKKEIISNDGRFEFYISSPNDYLIQSMIESYLEDPEVIFRGDKLSVENVELLKKPKFHQKVNMKTMSPIMARIKQNNKIWDLNPADLRFYDALQKNLLRKYKGFYGDYNGEEYVKIVPDMRSVKKKRILIKKGDLKVYNRAYQMRFTVEADSRLLNFLYDCGLGERNSMGFGMVMANGYG